MRTGFGVNYYKLRDRNVRKLGFACYEDYLESDLWKQIRTRTLTEHPQCWTCSSRATQIHHRSYSLSTLQGKKPGNLVPLCQDCHKFIEFDSRGRKVIHFSRVNAKLGQARSRYLRRLKNS